MPQDFKPDQCKGQWLGLFCWQKNHINNLKTQKFEIRISVFLVRHSFFRGLLRDPLRYGGISYKVLSLTNAKGNGSDFFVVKKITSTT